MENKDIDKIDEFRKAKDLVNKILNDDEVIEFTEQLNNCCSHFCKKDFNDILLRLNLKIISSTINQINKGIKDNYINQVS